MEKIAGSPAQRTLTTTSSAKANTAARAAQHPTSQHALPGDIISTGRAGAALGDRASALGQAMRLTELASKGLSQISQAVGRFGAAAERATDISSPYQDRLASAFQTLRSEISEVLEGARLGGVSALTGGSISVLAAGENEENQDQILPTVSLSTLRLESVLQLEPNAIVTAVTGAATTLDGFANDVHGIQAKLSDQLTALSVMQENQAASQVGQGDLEAIQVAFATATARIAGNPSAALEAQTTNLPERLLAQIS